MGEIIVIVLLLMLNAAAAAFVYRDCVRRGFDPWAWVMLVIFVPLIGVVAYLGRVTGARD